MELNRIREYIRKNPARWEEERFYGRETGDQIRETAAVYGEEDWMI
jgi:bisphosphoglycerate-dependent phosphoglycerate mutase